MILGEQSFFSTVKIKSNVSSIWFIFPELMLGGIPTLLLNLSKEFNRLDIRFNIITPKGSFLYNKLVIDKFEFGFIDLDYIDKSVVNKKIKSNDVLVVFSWYLELRYFIDINPRILFWNVFPDTYTRSIILPNTIRKIADPKYLMQNLISMLIRKNGLVFMDSAPFTLGANKYKINSSLVSYLPIPISLVSEQPLYSLTDKKKSQHKLRVVYIGRSIKWKIFPAIRIIEDLLKIKDNSFEISLTIVTENKQEFKEVLCNNKIYTPFDIKYIENITNENLDSFLLENCDLNISMGTACLESAKLGIPTIVVDASYSLISNNYKYKWLFESDSFCLGNIITNKTLFSGFALEDEIPRVFSNNLIIKNISNRCFSYVYEKHNIKNISLDLINYCNISTLRYSDLKNKMFIYTKLGIGLIYIKFHISLIFKFLLNHLRN